MVATELTFARPSDGSLQSENKRNFELLEHGNPSSGLLLFGHREGAFLELKIVELLLKHHWKS